MIIAQIQTTAGLLTIGLTDISEEQTKASLSALIRVLCELDDPIMVENNEVHVVFGAPADTPTSLTFRYLGSGIAKFDDLVAYSASMNEQLSLDVYMCATQVVESGDGRLTVDYQAFELQIDDSADATPDAVH